MGNKSQSYSPLDSFIPDQWEEVPLSDEQKQYLGSYKKMKNKITSEAVQKYEIMFNDQQDYKQYIESFNWRQHEDCIVNTKFLHEKHVKDFCSTTYVADVYIQSIPVRLSEVTDIPYPENLYVLYSTLQGYSKVFHFLGYLHPKENQVCVSSQGEVRVWINSDLSKNYPDQDDLLEAKEMMTESIMVNQIVEMISHNTDRDSEPMPMIEYFKRKNKLHPSFQQAKILIHEYSREYKTPIPECFESIMQMLNQNDGDNDEFRMKEELDSNRIEFGGQSFQGQHHLHGQKASTPLNNRINNTHRHIGEADNLDHSVVQQHFTGIPLPQHFPLKAGDGLAQVSNHNLKQSYEIPEGLFGRNLASMARQNQNHTISIKQSQMVPEVHQLFNRPIRPQSHFQYGSVPIAPLHFQQRQYPGKTLSDRNHYANHPFSFASGSILGKESNIRTGSNRSFTQHSPVSRPIMMNNQKPPSSNIQINFLQNVNENRRILMAGPQPMHLMNPRVVPVPVARTNFVKFVNSNSTQVVRPIRHQRKDSEVEARRDQERDIVRENFAPFESLAKQAKATETRQQTPVNFNELDFFVKNPQPQVREYLEEDRELEKRQVSGQIMTKLDRQDSYPNRLPDSNPSRSAIAQDSRSRTLAACESRNRTITPEASRNITVYTEEKPKQSKLYYTTTTQEMIDPQIAADLAFYANMGQL